MQHRSENVLIVPIQHGQPAAVRAVRSAIATERPHVIALEAGPRRAASGQLGRGIAHTFDVPSLCILGPIDAWLWSAFGTQSRLYARFLAGGETYDEMATAVDAAAGASSVTVCCDRDELVTLMRASVQGGWQWRMRIGIEAYTGLSLPPHSHVPLSTVVRLVWIAAWGDWEGAARHLRENLLTPCWAQNAAHAASPAGRAAIAWNDCALSVIRGRAIDPLFLDALREAGSRVVSCGVSNLGLPAAMTSERDQLMGWAVATVTPDGATRGVAVVGAAHAPGVARWVAEYRRRAAHGGVVSSAASRAGRPFPAPPEEIDVLLRVPESYMLEHVGGPLAGAGATVWGIARGLRRAPRATGLVISAAGATLAVTLGGLANLQRQWTRLLDPPRLDA